MRLGEGFSKRSKKMEKGGEIQHQAEIDRVAGEIALLSPEIDVAKAESYLKRALAVARQQQAKSWELRAAISILPRALVCLDVSHWHCS